jgi:ABC-type transporter Mla MlaB component
MVASNTTIIAFDGNRLSYEKACEIANKASTVRGHDMIRLELKRVVEATTAALARLIALRSSLRKSGHDLRITGLCGQAESIYEFNQMAALLPRDQHAGDLQNKKTQ